MRDPIRRLRSQARQFARGKAPNGIRYSAGFRAEVVALVRKRRSEGVAVARLARELGLSTQTLVLWLRQSSRSSLRPVRLMTEPTAEVPASAPTRPVLFTAGGLRIEGLDIDDLGRLLRLLG
jgi:transposase-like protein